MKNPDITIKITKPQNMEPIIKKYSITAAQIISKKLPKHTLNNLIKKLETNNEMNKGSSL